MRDYKKIARVAISAVAVVAWCCFMFSMSANDGDTSQGLSDKVCVFFGAWLFPDLNTTQAVELMSHAVRKTAHFTEYAVLGMLALNLLHQLGLKLDRLPLAGIAWACCVVFAASDEIHQSFVPDRSPQITDVCIDAAGALLGVLAFAGVLALIARRRRRQGNG